MSEVGLDDEIEQSLNLTDWDIEQVVDKGETVTFPYDDGHFIVSYTDDLPEMPDERYYIEADDDD